MRALACAVLFFAFSSLVYADAHGRRLSLGAYCGVLAECNVAAYAISRYVIAEAGGADSKRLQFLAPALSSQVEDFELKFKTLRAVVPGERKLQPLHRVFIKRYEGLLSWSKQLEEAFVSGNREALLRGVAEGRYLLRDLRDHYRAFSENMGHADLR